MERVVPTELIAIRNLRANVGQIEGIPRNPRKISDAKYQALKESLIEDPEMVSLRELIVYPHGKVYVVLCGNQRFRAMKELGEKFAPCKVVTEDWDKEKLIRIAVKDSNSYGEYDTAILAKEYDFDLLLDCSLDIELNIAGQTGGGGDGDDLPTDVDVDDAETEEGDEEDLETATEDYNEVMVKDILFAADNDYEIPVLLKDMQAGKLELPLNTWGANSRLRKDVSTYHFYVDDYRFNAIFKDPSKLLSSGCKAIVEPNISLHDQTPIAFGLMQIYKKRWLARYAQDCGIRVYADLNVAQKFVEYNKMGIPKGYNAFFTRGLTDWDESLKSDLAVAQEISGLEVPNLIVYGGGKKVEKFCQEHGLLYVTDFINAKKI